MAKLVTTNLRFPKGTYEDLRLQAARRGTTIAGVVREAVERHLGRSEDEPIPFGQDPMDKWIGAIEGSAGDESVNHDHYLYEWPKETELEASRGFERDSRPGAARRSKSRGGDRLHAKKPHRALRAD